MGRESGEREGGEREREGEEREGARERERESNVQKQSCGSPLVKLKLKI